MHNYSLYALLLRLPMGMLFFFAGLGKIMGGYSQFATGLIDNTVKNTFLPYFAVAPFAWSLPALEIIIGFLFLVGFKTRITGIVMALLLTNLAFGMALMKEHATVANNIQYVFFTVAALYFSDEGNEYSVDALLAKKM